MGKKVKYRVTYLESERGWGQKTFTVDYDTYEAAKKAIDDTYARNNEEFVESGGVVPDYYIQTHSDKIEAVEV